SFDELRKKLIAKGYPDIADQLDGAVAFDIAPLYPPSGDGRDEEIEMPSFTSVFRKYQEVVKIESEGTRMSFGLFDKAKPREERKPQPWRQLGSVTYLNDVIDKETGEKTLGEVLGLSITLPEVSN